METIDIQNFPHAKRSQSFHSGFLPPAAGRFSLIERDK
jgi:hypothetical protein